MKLDSRFRGNDEAGFRGIAEMTGQASAEQ